MENQGLGTHNVKICAESWIGNYPIQGQLQRSLRFLYSFGNPGLLCFVPASAWNRSRPLSIHCIVDQIVDMVTSVNFSLVLRLTLMIRLGRVSVQGVKSLGGHFCMFMPGVWILWSKKKIVIIFQKENGNTFTLLIIFIVKSLQKEQNSTNLLL